MRTDLYVEGVLSKCVALQESGIWAPEPVVRPEAWLNNFSGVDEQLLATILLDNLIFYSDRAADRLLRAAYTTLEDGILSGAIQVDRSPGDFVDAMIFAPVEGEEPRPTDSGKALCRKLRNINSIDDTRFVTPRDAVGAAASGTPIVLVDDFLGSGQQLIRTWKRHYCTTDPMSLEQAYRTRQYPIMCLALVATQTAISHIASEAPPIVVHATHVIDASYSVAALSAPVLSPPLADFQGQLKRLLEKYAPSLVLEPFLQSGEPRLFGFHSLGLMMAFEHGVPDSTLPIIRAEGAANWARLVTAQ